MPSPIRRRATQPTNASLDLARINRPLGGAYRSGRGANSAVLGVLVEPAILKLPPQFPGGIEKGLIRRDAVPAVQAATCSPFSIILHVSCSPSTSFTLSHRGDLAGRRRSGGFSCTCYRRTTDRLSLSCLRSCPCKASDSRSHCRLHERGMRRCSGDSARSCSCSSRHRLPFARANTHPPTWKLILWLSSCALRSSRDGRPILWPCLARASI